VKELPASISKLKNLKELILDNNKDLTISDELSGLVGLTRLSLSFVSGLRALNVGRLSNLRQLDLGYTGLTDVPLVFLG
jgi:Leucine-rich repeat (LRR) protein